MNKDKCKNIFSSYLFYFLMLAIVLIVFSIALIVLTSLKLELRWCLAILFTILSIGSLAWIIYKVIALIKRPIFSNPLYLFSIVSIFSISSGLAIHYFLYDSSLNGNESSIDKGAKIFNKIRISLQQRFEIHDEHIKKIYGFDINDNNLIVYHLNETSSDDKYYVSYIELDESINDINSAFNFIDEFKVGNVENELIFVNNINTPFKNENIEQKLKEFDFNKSIHFLDYDTLSNQRYSLELFNIWQNGKDDYLLITYSHSNKEVKYLKTSNISYYVFLKMVDYYK